MDVTKFHLSLFFLQISSLWAQLEPPSNVTLHCKNLHNIVEWNYGEIPPGLTFKVDVKSDTGLNGCTQPPPVEHPPLQADVSCFSYPGVFYFLTVKAVYNGTESALSPQVQIEFSYYEGFDTTQKCYLDLPSVNITSQAQSQVVLRLDHPCLLYHQKMPECQKSMKKRKKPVELPLFKYNVEFVSTGKSHTFECDERVCEETLDMSGEQKHCLKIDGELEMVTLKPTQEHYCIPPPPPPLSYTGIIIGVVVAATAAFALIGFMVYRKYTQPSSPLPPSIKNPIATHNSSHPQLNSPDEFCRIQEPSSPTPLLTTTDEDCQSDSSLNRCVEDDLRMRIGIPPEDDGARADMEQSSLRDLRSPYMDGNDLEDNDGGAAHSDYERREAVV